MADLRVNFCGTELRNPVVTLSGTCGTGKEYTDYYKISDIGAISVKGMTIEPRAGNPPPRVAETPSGMLNSIGLQNPGAAYFIERDLPRLKRDGAVVIANIAGATEDDYVRAAELFAPTDADFIELNVSCPNIHGGGAAFGSDCAVIERLTRRVRDACRKPVIVKLSPNVTDIVEMARAAESGGADALCLINTLVGMRIDIKTRRPVLRRNVGGLSGPAILPVAVRMVWQVKSAVPLPVIGCGGVASAEDAVEMMMAGADAVGVGTAMFTDPYAPLKIIKGLSDWCDANGVARAAELTGTVEPWQ